MRRDVARNLQRMMLAAWTVLRVPILAIPALTGCAGQPGAETGPAYVDEIRQYRHDRETRLRGEDGWLTLIGLFWLEPGENGFGSDPANVIVLPEDASPQFAGAFHYEAGAVRLEAAPAARLSLEGRPVTEWTLPQDPQADPAIFELGRLRFFVIERSGRHAVRVRDTAHPDRLAFGGLEYYPVDAGYKVLARLQRFDEPREMQIATVLDTTTTLFAPGLLEFELNGERRTLLPFVSDLSDTELFIIIRDETSGIETYGAGRYLSADRGGDQVSLDFNKAYNPPCAFTRYATCPLPPAENRLPTRIEAGEKAYHKGS